MSRSRRHSLPWIVAAFVLFCAGLVVYLWSRPDDLREYVSPPLEAKGSVVRLLIPAGWSNMRLSAANAKGAFFHPEIASAWLPRPIRGWIERNWARPYDEVGFLWTAFTGRSGQATAWRHSSFRGRRGNVAEQYWKHFPGHGVVFVVFGRASNEPPDSRIPRILASIRVQ